MITSPHSRLIPAVATSSNQTNGDQLVQISDNHGNRSEITTFGELHIGHREDDVSIQFQYNVSTWDITTSVVSTGTVTQADAMLVVGSGVGATAEAHAESKNGVRYRPGHQADCYFTTLYANGGVANSIQLHGAISQLDEDGFFFGYNGTAFSVGYIKASSYTYIAQSSWNGDKLDGTGSSGYTLDTTKLNIYRISWAWLGASPVVFEVYCGVVLGWVVVHIIEFHNVQATPSINNPVLQVQMHIVKTSGATNIVMKSGSWRGGIVNGGSDIAGKRFFGVQASKSISATTETNIVTIKNNATFQSKTNLVKIELQYLSASADGTKNVRITITKNATLGGTPSYTSIDATNSVVSYDVAGTTVTGGTFEASFQLDKTGKFNENIVELEIYGHPGDTITLSAYSTGASDIVLSLREVEFF